MIERVQRVTLEGGEGSERERKGAHTPPSLRQDRLNDPLPLRHTEIKKKSEHRRGMNLPLVNCLLFSISMHSPCLSAPPSSFNYSPSFACFSFRLSRSTSSTSLRPTRTHTRFLSFHTPRDSRFPGSFLFLGKPAFNVSPRLNVEGWKHKDGRHGGWECPLTLGIGETEIKKGRNIPRSDFNFRRRRLKRSSTTNASRLFLEIRWIIFVWKKGGGRAFS